MNLEEIRNAIYSLVSFFGFNYNQKNCGVDPISHTQYEMWYGEEKTYTAKSIDDVLSVPLFNGKSINEIYNEIEITDVY